MSNHSYPTDKCTFELLSAYLDGEVTSEQRKEVQELLANDADTQGLYRRLLTLRQEFNNLPIPQSQYSSNQVAQGVFAKIDQEKKQRKRLFIGGSAIAVATVATIAGLFSNNRNPIFQMAQEQTDTNSSLMLALNEPLIELPPMSGEEALAISVHEPLLDIINQP